MGTLAGRRRGAGEYVYLLGAGRGRYRSWGMCGAVWEAARYGHWLRRGGCACVFVLSAGVCTGRGKGRWGGEAEGGVWVWVCEVGVGGPWQAASRCGFKSADWRRCGSRGRGEGLGGLVPKFGERVKRAPSRDGMGWDGMSDGLGCARCFLERGCGRTGLDWRNGESNVGCRKVRNETATATATANPCAVAARAAASGRDNPARRVLPPGGAHPHRRRHAHASALGSPAPFLTFTRTPTEDP
ncbi:hypothetical protein CALCODRAFT_142314 [Calocera cornea HHB12733]|uniref:Uncharacterized protein n=1 Tax=Calocera cornea HHB12733 TaxID=1353952 RepID=A0A165I5J2_9BASI|nr:hypothetical protein CALCODRAFT_142314 [Calocera cornea HHB12733]